MSFYNSEMYQIFWLIINNKTFISIFEETYKSFVIYNKSEDTYKSFVIYNKSEDSIHVPNINGPLKHLENEWFFKQEGDASEVEFHVDFELKNKILNVLMIKSFDLGLKKIADAFEKRAIQLFEKTWN